MATPPRIQSTTPTLWEPIWETDPDAREGRTVSATPDGHPTGVCPSRLHAYRLPRLTTWWR